VVVAVVLTCALVILIAYGMRLLITGRGIVGIAVAVLAVAGVVLVWRPDEATRIANLLGVGRGADLLLYLMFVLLVLLVLLVHGKFRRYDETITELARSAALAHAQVPRPRDVGESDPPGETTQEQ
jgi:small membrane protein